MGQPQSHNKQQQHRGYFNPEYEVIRIVDDPIYGRIKHIKEKNSKNMYLLKELAFNANKFFDEELEVLKARISFDHPNIVRMIGYNVMESQQLCSKMFKIFIFIERLDNDLDSQLREKIANGDPYTENELLFIAENLTSLLYNLQMRNTTHGDIRPSNVFYSEKEQVFKLTDPQLEVDRNSTGLTKAVIHRAETYLAPEILENVPKRKVEHHADKYKTDVFSLGATLLGLATLTHSEELFDYMNGVLNEDLLRERLERVQATYSTFTYELILEMLAYDHYNRPNFIDIEDKLLPYHEVIRHKKPLPFRKEHAFELPHSAEELPVASEHNECDEHERVERNAATSKASAIQAKPLESIEILSEECEVREEAEEEERVLSSNKAPDHKSDGVFNTSSGLQDEDYPDEQEQFEYEYHDEIVKSKSSVEQWRSKNEIEPDDDLDMQIKRALRRTQETYKQVQEVDSLPVYIDHHLDHHDDGVPHHDTEVPHQADYDHYYHNHHPHEDSALVEAYDGEKVHQKHEEKEQFVAEPHPHPHPHPHLYLHKENHTDAHASAHERRNFISFGIPDPHSEVKKSEVLEFNKKINHNDDLKRSQEIADIVKEFLKPSPILTPKKSDQKSFTPSPYALEEGSVSLRASSNLQDLYKSPLYSAQNYYGTSNLGIPSANANQIRPLYSEVVTASVSREIQNLGYLTPSRQHYDYSSYAPSHGNSAIRLNFDSM